MIDHRLIALDTETTCLTNNKKIVELYILHPSTGLEFYSLINPEMLISEGASAIHNIKDENVADEPTFKDILPKLKEFLPENPIICAYNGMFDCSLLEKQFAECGETFPEYQLVDPYKIFKTKFKQRLIDASEYYLGETLEGAHEAKNDVIATYKILLKQMELYSLSIEDCINISGDGKIEEYKLRFGKHKNRMLKEIPVEYLQWCLQNFQSSNITTIIKKYLMTKK